LHDLWHGAVLLTGDPVDAQRLAEATVARAARDLKPVPPEGDFKRHVFRIMVRLYESLRRERARPADATPLPRESADRDARVAEVPPAAGTSPSPLEDQLIATVAALPDELRIPVLLSDTQGFRYRDIAAILDVPVGAVRARIWRGRQALLDVLEPAGGAAVQADGRREI